MRKLECRTNKKQIINVIKLLRDRTKVTSEEEKRVWNHIDTLYSKLEEGNATEDEFKQIDGISKIIMDVISKSSKVKKEKRLQFFHSIKYVGVGVAACILLVMVYSYAASEKLADKTDTIAYNVIQCQNDSVVHLTDGTVVYLAGGSNLSIANNFGKEDRTVALTGEAFFEVAKDKNKSFIVETKDINAIVHGTSFNVVAYNGTAESHVSVRTGCVEVTKGKQSFGKFHCGDRVIYDNIAHRALNDTVNPDNIGAWTTGGFVLENATVEEMIIRVKNRFHRELLIEKNAIPADARINYCSYRPEQSGVDNVMRNICAIYNTQYEISENRIVVSN